MWQDKVISMGQWFFAVTLLPTILGEQLPPLSTSVPTGLILVVFSATFATLRLKNSSLSSLVVGCVWLGIAVKTVAIGG